MMPFRILYAAASCLTLVSCAHAVEVSWAEASPPTSPSTSPSAAPLAADTVEIIPTEPLRVHGPSAPLQSNGCLPEPSKPTPSSLRLPNGGTANIVAYGHDVTDRSEVFWDQPYPSPCFDDNPARKGLPNAAWQASAWIEGQNLCLGIAGLQSRHPPGNTLQVGYSVALTGATFAGGGTRRTFVLYEFSRAPRQHDMRACLPLQF